VVRPGTAAAGVMIRGPLETEAAPAAAAGGDERPGGSLVV